MNGLPSNLVVCCKTIYFNILNKLYHLIIYTFHIKQLFNKSLCLNKEKCII